MKIIFWSNIVQYQQKRVRHHCAGRQLTSTHGTTRMLGVPDLVSKTSHYVSLMALIEEQKKGKIRGGGVSCGM